MITVTATFSDLSVTHTHTVSTANDPEAAEYELVCWLYTGTETDVPTTYIETVLEWFAYVRDYKLRLLDESKSTDTWQWIESE